MLDPSTVYLDHAVELAQDVVLEPNVMLRGATVGRRADADRDRIAGVRLADRRGLRDLGERHRALDRGGRGHDRPVQPPAARDSHVGRRSEIGNFAELKNSTPRRARPPAPQQLPGRRRRRRRHERRRGHDHGQLRRREQAPHDDRGGGLPRRRHDAPRAGHPRRRVEDRRRGGRHARRPAGQARGGRPGADPRAASRREMRRPPATRATAKPGTAEAPTQAPAAEGGAT